MTERPRTWAEFMRQCHERGLPAEVLEDLAKLEQDGLEDENQDDEDNDGAAMTDEMTWPCGATITSGVPVAELLE